LYRDHYEGTEFDLTKGIAAGPYGEPNRFVGPYDGDQNDVSKDKTMSGAWERPISVFYQGYTYVCQVRPGKPDITKGVTWFGPDVSYTTVFMPFYSKVTELPVALQTGGPQQFNGMCAWWPFNFVNNWSRLNFSHMTKNDIIPLQQLLEIRELGLIQETDRFLQTIPEDEAKKKMTEFCQTNTRNTLARWWELAATLVAKYSDGYINLPGDSYSYPELDPTRAIGYPAPWLNVTDYRRGPTTYDMK